MCLIERVLVATGASRMELPVVVRAPDTVRSLLNVVLPVTVTVPADVKRTLPDVSVERVRLAPVVERLLA